MNDQRSGLRHRIVDGGRCDGTLSSCGGGLGQQAGHSDQVVGRFHQVRRQLGPCQSAVAGPTEPTDRFHRAEDLFNAHPTMLALVVPRMTCGAPVDRTAFNSRSGGIHGRPPVSYTASNVGDSSARARSARVCWHAGSGGDVLHHTQKAGPGRVSRRILESSEPGAWRHDRYRWTLGLQCGATRRTPSQQAIVEVRPRPGKPQALPLCY
jgi:hypothetical protein